MSEKGKDGRPIPTYEEQKQAFKESLKIPQVTYDNEAIYETKANLILQDGIINELKNELGSNILQRNYNDLTVDERIRVDVVQQLISERVTEWKYQYTVLNTSN